MNWTAACFLWCWWSVAKYAWCAKCSMCDRVWSVSWMHAKLRIWDEFTEFGTHLLCLALSGNNSNGIPVSFSLALSLIYEFAMPNTQQQHQGRLVWFLLRLCDNNNHLRAAVVGAAVLLQVGMVGAMAHRMATTRWKYSVIWTSGSLCWFYFFYILCSTQCEIPVLAEKNAVSNCFCIYFFLLLIPYSKVGLNSR